MADFTNEKPTRIPITADVEVEYLQAIPDEVEAPPTPSPEIIIEIIKRITELEERIASITTIVEQIADNGERFANVLLAITEKIGNHEPISDTATNP